MKEHRKVEQSSSLNRLRDQQGLMNTAVRGETLTFTAASSSSANLPLFRSKMYGSPFLPFLPFPYTMHKESAVRAGRLGESCCSSSALLAQQQKLLRSPTISAHWEPDKSVAPCHQAHLVTSQLASLQLRFLLRDKWKLTVRDKQAPSDWSQVASLGHGIWCIARQTHISHQRESHLWVGRALGLSGHGLGHLGRTGLPRRAHGEAHRQVR